MVRVLINRENVSREELDKKERIAATNWLETQFAMRWEMFGKVDVFEWYGEKVTFWRCYIPEEWRPKGYRYPGKMFEYKFDHEGME